MKETLRQIDELHGRILELEKDFLKLEEEELRFQTEYERLRGEASLLRSPRSPRTPGFVYERIERLKAILSEKSRMLDETRGKTKLLFRQTDRLKNPVYTDLRMPVSRPIVREKKSGALVLYTLGKTVFAVEGLPLKRFRFLSGRKVGLKSAEKEMVYFPEKPEMFTGAKKPLQLLVYRVAENAFLALWCEKILKIRYDQPDVARRAVRPQKPNRWISGSFKLEGQYVNLIRTNLSANP